MFSSEVSNDVVEDPTSEWDDEVNFEDDDDLEELQIGGIGDENYSKDVNDLNQSNRPPTTKSFGSLRSDGKRIRLKHQRQPLYNFGSIGHKRDPVIESIIQSRKFSIIENPYTRLAQVISQVPRPSQRISPYEIRPLTTETENDIKDRILSPQNGITIPSSIAADLDNEGLDDGLTGEYERGVAPAIEKSCIRLYEETCKRLNISSCSMIIRSLNTTKINLRNYGLGLKGCAALAVALVRNTTVLSLNLSQNNIGSNGMSYIYQIITENPYIEEYDLSFNNLGTKGINKLANAIIISVQVKTLNVAGNELNASDIKILLSKLEDHPNLKNLNISHNDLEEEGGSYVAKWLSDNIVLLNLDISWCSIRLIGAKTIAKAIGDNNKLISLDLSYNSFTNDTVELIINSLKRNMTLCELNLCGNQLICRYDEILKENPLNLINGKDSQIYKLIESAATNQSLKIFRLGQNHIDARCLMIMLESLSKLNEITLEELDLTGFISNPNEILKVHSLFSNYPKLTCYVGPVRQTTEHFTNNLLNLIHTYCQKHEVSLSDIFNPNEGSGTITLMITHEQFLDGLRKARIPFQITIIEDIMKYLGRDNEQGLIPLRSLNIG